MTARVLVVAPMRLEGMGGAERHARNLPDVLRDCGCSVHVASEAQARPWSPVGRKLVRALGDASGALFSRRITFEPGDYDLVLSFGFAGAGIEHPGHLRVMAGSHSAFRHHALAPVSAPMARLRRAAVDAMYLRLERAASGGLGALACSEGLRRDAQALGLPVRDEVVYPPTDTTRFAPGSRSAALRHLGLSNRAKYLAVVGRWEYAKGADRLERLAQQLPAGVSLLLAGPEASQVPASVRERAAMCRPVSPDDVRWLYQAAHCTLLASRFEGASMVLAESQACATPVLTTAVGSGYEMQYVDSAVRADVVHEADDPRAWLAALEPHLEAGDAAQQLRQAARRHAVEHYGTAAVRRQWAALLATLGTR